MADRTDGYEYVAIEVRSTAPKNTRADDALTEKLNEVASHGWRLVSVLPGGQYGGGHAIFEREVVWDG